MQFISKGPKASKPAAATWDFNQFNIPAHRISRNAIKVVESLQQAGYSAYIVGGGVRDLLLNLKPKDFDVATNATPEQVKQVFRSALIIGRRFRIVHVRFGREVIEVTTFRAHHDADSSTKHAKQAASGVLLLDNVYGNIESDALRRDFTVNALYLNPTQGQLHDFTNGLEDLKQRRLRIIGDPSARYREDPVRMLRAVRFAAKLGFQLESATQAPIRELAPLLEHISSARLFDEVLKLLLSGSATACLALLKDFQLLGQLFPGTQHCLNQDPSAFNHTFIERVALNTDKRLRADLRVTPAFLFGAFLWLPYLANLRRLEQNSGLPPADTQLRAGTDVVNHQLTRTAIPKRFLIPMREIWDLQFKLPKRDGERAAQLLAHPRFRAAYDFLLLREESGEDLQGLGQWWTEYQQLNEPDRSLFVAELEPIIPTPKPRRRRPRRRTPKPQDPT